jgi:hypothetical protein
LKLCDECYFSRFFTKSRETKVVSDVASLKHHILTHISDVTLTCYLLQICTKV